MFNDNHLYEDDSHLFFFFQIKLSFLISTKNYITMALSNDELACVYAALILADDNVPISGDKIATILKAANYDIEPYWPDLFANALEGIQISDLINKIGAAPVAAPAQATSSAANDNKAAGGGEAAKKEEQKQEKDEDSEEEDMVLLFCYFV